MRDRDEVVTQLQILTPGGDNGAAMWSVDDINMGDRIPFPLQSEGRHNVIYGNKGRPLTQVDILNHQRLFTRATNFNKSTGWQNGHKKKNEQTE